jgi:hypothetical protein
MIIMILFVVAMFLWFISLTPPAAPYAAIGRPWIAWICVLLLGIFLFVPGIR